MFPINRPPLNDSISLNGEQTLHTGLLNSLGIDTNSIEKKVDNDLQKTIVVSDNDFQEDFQHFVQKGDDEITAAKKVLNYYKDNGFLAKDFSIDDRLQEIKEVEGTVDNYNDLNIKDNKKTDNISENQESDNNILDSIGNVINKSGDEVLNAGQGAIAEIPSIIGNAGAFFIGKPVDYVLDKFNIDLPSLEEQFKKDAQENKDKFLDLMGADKDSGFTKAGGVGSEIGSLFVPGSTIPKIEKLNKLKIPFEKFAEYFPKTSEKIVNLVPKDGIIRGGLEGAKEAAKFDIIDEGDISSKDLAIGGTLGAGTKIGGKVIDTFNPFSGNNEQLLRKIIGIKPSQLKKVGLKGIKEDNKILLDLLEQKGKAFFKNNEITRENLLRFIQQEKNNIYTNKINKIISNTKGDIKTDNLYQKIEDNIYTDINGGKFTLGINEDAGFKKSMETLQKILQNIDSLDQLELVKKYISLNARKLPKDSSSKEVYNIANKVVQDEFDKILEKLGGEGIKQYKRQYAGLSNLEENLWTQVAKDMRDSGSLIENFGIFATLNQLLTRDIEGAINTATSAGILSKLKDPDTKLKRLLNNLYGKEGINIYNKFIGAISNKLGDYTDNK